MRIVGIAALLVFQAPFPACAQTQKQANPDIPLIQALDAASASIQHQHSDIPSVVLRQDKSAILMAAPAIGEAYKVLPAGKPPEPLVEQWKSMRDGEFAVSGTQPLGVAQFIRYGFAIENAKGKISDNDYVRMSSYLIGRKAPTLASSTLRGDQETVLKALPSLRKQYENRGFTAAEANDAAIWVWDSLRTGPRAMDPRQPLSFTELVEDGSRIGRLLIQSVPSGASVTVDAQPWPDPTDTAEFAEAGHRIIVLSMPQYETLREVFLVEADKINKFKRTLRKKP